MNTAAGIIIGDEILSGKVQDSNVHLLIDSLRAAGVALRRIATIGDDPREIAEEVRRCAAAHTYVITSGGIGPTHDDRTVEGVALAFDCPVRRHPELEALVRRYWGERVNEAALKLACIPEGTRIIEGEDRFFPAIVYRNVYILPGIPQLFAAKLASLRGEFVGSAVTVMSVYLSLDESFIAAQLTQVAGELPGVSIGSYPRLGDPDHRVRVTLEGERPAEVEQALERLLALLPAEGVIRVER